VSFCQFAQAKCKLVSCNKDRLMCLNSQQLESMSPSLSVLMVETQTALSQSVLCKNHLWAQLKMSNRWKEHLKSSNSKSVLIRNKSLSMRSALLSVELITRSFHFWILINFTPTISTRLCTTMLSTSRSLMKIKNKLSNLEKMDLERELKRANWILTQIWS
jgi:hypothetical protein